MFTFEDLKKCTKSFSQANDIGSGGFGKVVKVPFKLKCTIVIVAHVLVMPLKKFIILEKVLCKFYLNINKFDDTVKHGITNSFLLLSLRVVI